MVDSVKSRNGSSGVPTPNSSSLRNNFQNLSSGLKIAEAVAQDKFTSTAKVQSAVSEKTEKAEKKSQKLDRAVSSLNDAVSLSAQVLESLSALTESDDSPDPVKELAKDLEEVRRDVSTVLKELQQRADRASVIKENLDSAEPNLQDLSAAQARAEDIGLQIVDGDVSLIEAHDITPERVAQLLADD